MTSTLPPEVRAAFEGFITCEYTTIDARQQPITWPVTPYYSQGAATIDITTRIGAPKMANDARRNPRVSLLFSDPTGFAGAGTARVLVQGTADVDDRDLDANRDVKVRPERVFVWPGGDATRPPEILDARLEEVRSGHIEEPLAPHAGPSGGDPAWDPRIEQLGERHREAVLSWVAPDGFPLSVRLPVGAEPGSRRVRIGAEPAGMPLIEGPACLAAHRHGPGFEWQENFQVRGDLVREGDGWSLEPRKLVSGFEG